MSSFFEGQGANWQPQHRPQQSWDRAGDAAMAQQQQQQGHSSHSAGAGNAAQASQAENGPAFSSQFEEITRASDNLMKNSKLMGMHGRRESMPAVGPFARQFPDLDHRMGPSRHHSVDYDGMRANSSHSSSSLQGFLQHQRFGSRPTEADQMMQAKRRAAAQRERDLRNYHQEQQYNRSASNASRGSGSFAAAGGPASSQELSGAKSDRSMSPNTITEEDRRELIARQHRALYGDASSLYMNDSSAPSSRPISQDARVLASSSGGQGSSPLGYNSYSVNAQSVDSTPSTATAGVAVGSGNGSGQQSRSRANSSTSKSPKPANLSVFDAAQQASRTSASSPGGSPTRSGAIAPGSSAVGPIGSRPTQTGVQGKRNTPPMPSPLSYGFTSDNKGNNSTERSASAASNPAQSGNEKNNSNNNHLGGWSSNSGPWGSNKSLGVQASVWG